MDKARLAVDIGGTFTDLALESGGKRTRGTGVNPPDLGRIVPGTTLATNAIIERKGAKTALIVTEGFRDSIEMAFEHRFEQYDIFMRKPPPLVARDLRFGVPERLDCPRHGPS